MYYYYFILGQGQKRVWSLKQNRLVDRNVRDNELYAESQQNGWIHLKLMKALGLPGGYIPNYDYEKGIQKGDGTWMPSEEWDNLRMQVDLDWAKRQQKINLYVRIGLTVLVLGASLFIWMVI